MLAEGKKPDGTAGPLPLDKDGNVRTAVGATTAMAADNNGILTQILVELRKIRYALESELGYEIPDPNA